MERLNLCKEVLENAIGVYKTCAECSEEPLAPLEAVSVQAMEELLEYRKLKEQGKLLRLPMIVEDIISRLFSHNEIIALWKEVKVEVAYHELLWRGMAWEIPKEYKNCKFVKIFGTIPENIGQADTINIEVVLSEEAEAALEKMKGE